MRQAIITKYFGATNTRPSKVKATAEAGTVSLSWDYELDTEGNHIAAARALAEKYGDGWSGAWFGGGTKDGYVFVNAKEQAFEIGR